VIVNVLFLGVGLLLGYLGGVYSTLRVVKHRRLTTQEAMLPFRDLRAIPSRANEWLKRWFAPIVIALFAISAFSVYQGSHNHNADQRSFSAQGQQLVHQQHRLKHLVQALKHQNTCLVQFANRTHDSLVPRQTAAKRLQRADNVYNQRMQTLFSDFLRTPLDQIKIHKDFLRVNAALSAKIALAAELNRDRARNPYPPPPKKVCPRP